MQDWHLAVDIGGTFTDVVLLDAAGTTTVIEKVLTTPKEPAARRHGRRAPRARAAAGVAARDVRYVIHGTTLVTNALIERKGAPHRPHHHGRPRGRARDRPRDALRRLRPRPREARAAGAAAAAARDSARASWPTAASASPVVAAEVDARRRPPARRRRRGGRGEPAARLTAIPRTSRRWRGALRERAPGAARVAVVGGLRRDPRVRAHLDHGGQRVRARRRSRPISRALERAAPRRGLRGPAPADAVERRDLHGARPPARCRSGSWSPGRPAARRPPRTTRAPRGARARARLRHGRHHRQDLPDRRRRAADHPRVRGGARVALQARQRPAAAACRSSS